MREDLLTRGALFTLNLQLGDLACVVDVEVLKDGLGSLLVLVADLLGLGVNLLLSLLLTTAEAKNHVNGGLILETKGLNGALSVEDGKTVDQNDLLSSDASLLRNLLPIKIRCQKSSLKSNSFQRLISYIH